MIFSMTLVENDRLWLVHGAGGAETRSFILPVAGVAMFLPPSPGFILVVRHAAWSGSTS